MGQPIDISEKIQHQLLRISKLVGQFTVTKMSMIALAALIVITYVITYHPLTMS